MACLRCLWTLAVLVVAINLAAARPAKKGSKYVFILFGDSLTDTGNCLAAAGVPDPRLYYKGRFTNGPNWVDALKGAMVKKQYNVQVFNYAYGAATACPNADLNLTRPYVKDLTAQTAAFVADVKAGKIPTGADIKVVPIQYIGVNDLMYFFNEARAANRTPSFTEIFGLVKGLITCRIAAMQAVAAALPGVRDLVLLPLVPLHISPSIPAAMKPGLTQVEDIIANQTAMAVAGVQAMLDSVPTGSPGAGVKLHLLGDYRWIERGGQKVRPPFTVFDAPCFWQVTSVMEITPGLQACTNPEEYLFYDQVHPTSRFHSWFALKGVLPRLQQLRVLPANI